MLGNCSNSGLGTCWGTGRGGDDRREHLGSTDICSDCSTVRAQVPSQYLVSQLPSALCTACKLKNFNVNHAGARNNNCRSVATRYTAIASPWFDPRLAFASTS